MLFKKHHDEKGHIFGVFFLFVFFGLVNVNSFTVEDTHPEESFLVKVSKTWCDVAGDFLPPSNIDVNPSHDP